MPAKAKTNNSASNLGFGAKLLLTADKWQNNMYAEEYKRVVLVTDLVDCMVALLCPLFYSTQIPICLWFLAKNKNADAKWGASTSLENELALATRIDHR